jgi:hypothetical protein
MKIKPFFGLMFLFTLAYPQQYITLKSPASETEVLKKNVATVFKDYELSITFLEAVNGVVYLNVGYAYSKCYIAPSSTPDRGGNSYSRSGDNLIEYSKIIYRTHRFCPGNHNTTLQNKGVEIIDLSGGYRNITGCSRFQEQCIDDGSFDGFYDERVDYGKVDFQLNKPKYNDSYTITVLKATNDQATVTVSPVNAEYNFPVHFEPLNLPCAPAAPQLTPQSPCVKIIYDTIVVYKYVFKEIAKEDTLSHNKIKMHVYPNPTDRKINIHLLDEAHATDYSIRIINETSKIVVDMKCNQFNVDIDLNNNPSGFYFIQLLDAQSNIVDKYKIEIVK